LGADGDIVVAWGQCELSDVLNRKKILKREAKILIIALRSIRIMEYESGGSNNLLPVAINRNSALRYTGVIVLSRGSPVINVDGDDGPNSAVSSLNLVVGQRLEFLTRLAVTDFENKGR
jgi:hypothetical protein